MTGRFHAIKEQTVSPCLCKDRFRSDCYYAEHIVPTEPSGIPPRELDIGSLGGADFSAKE